MANRKLRYEEAIERIREIIARAEGDFRNKNRGFPSLVREEDYVLLADHLDIIAEEEKTTYVDKEGDSIPAISVHDIAFVLMRNYLERQEFFRQLGQDRQRDAFDGFVGILDYHPPEREYIARISALRRLREQMRDKMPEDFDDFRKEIYNISKACFLKSISGEERERGYRKIGTWVVNPSGHMYMWLSSRGKTYEGLIKCWSEISTGSRVHSRYD